MFRENYLENNNKKLDFVENLSAEQFEKKLIEDKNAMLIDVRTQVEHNTSRLPNSVLIDIYNPTFLMQIDKLDRTKNYYLYCRSGNRSYIAGQQMKKMGFGEVYNLQPGIIGWSGPKENS
jgi:rhodanese-related sulfurtransferase